jgi:hypothetical protein
MRLRTLGRWLGLLLLCAGLPQAWAQGQLINGNRVLTGTLNAATTTGTATAYVLTLNPPITTYVPNQCFTFKAHVTNTGAATIAVNTAGAVSLHKYVSQVSTALGAGDIANGQVLSACYDGTNMQLVGGVGSTGAPGGGPTIDCDYTGTQFLNYDLGTNTWSCGPVTGGTGGAPINASYWVSTPNATLNTEVNMGALPSGILKHTVTGGISSPAIATPGTDYVQPGGTVATASALATNKPPCPANQFVRDTDPDGTLGCAQPSSAGLSDSADLVRLTTVQKVSNKQNVPREVLYTPAGAPLTITPNCDTTDVVVVDAIAGPLTINDPVCTGTNPEKSQELLFRLFSTASRVLTFGTGYSEEAGVLRPAATTGDGVTYDYLKFMRNSVTSRWDLVAVKATDKTVTTQATATGAATFACNANTSRQCQITSTATAGAGILIQAPGGAPVDGQLLMLLLLCQNVQGITYDASNIFIASTSIPLPTSCPADLNRHLVMGFRFSAILAKWQILASSN